jgi:mannose-1-phosphate guanylyltransferase
MFQQTLGRAERIVPGRRLLTVITRSHRSWALPQLRPLRPENILIQPENRDTAPGMLLPAMVIATRDPQATIAFLPSDHFIREEARFLDRVREAAALVGASPDLLVLLGMTPEGPEIDYGWIEPGERLGSRDDPSLFSIRRFWEKPDAATATALFAAGRLWNSFVLIGKVRQLLRLFRSHLPDLYHRFAEQGDRLGRSLPEGDLDRLYRNLPRINVSRDLLTRVPDRLAVLRVSGILWSDWGTEERIFATLRRLGRTEELLRRLEPGTPAPCLAASA